MTDYNSVVGKFLKPESKLNKKHNAICFRRVREAVADEIERVGKEVTAAKIADLLKLSKADHC
jgi:hypothetical protein